MLEVLVNLENKKVIGIVIAVIVMLVALVLYLRKEHFSSSYRNEHLSSPSVKISIPPPPQVKAPPSIDCVTSAWNIADASFSCPTTCGMSASTLNRNRTIVTPVQGNGKVCGNLYESKACPATASCPTFSISTPLASRSFTSPQIKIQGILIPQMNEFMKTNAMTDYLNNLVAPDARKNVINLMNKFLGKNPSDVDYMYVTSVMFAEAIRRKVDEVFTPPSK